MFVCARVQDGRAVCPVKQDGVMKNYCKGTWCGFITAGQDIKTGETLTQPFFPIEDNQTA